MHVHTESKLAELERKLGLDEGFLYGLKSENDWSLILKSHALLEASCNTLLAEELGHTEIIDAFSQVQMGTTKSGKLAFLASLKLLDKQQISFLDHLGWIRNKFAHDIRNTNRSLEDFFKSIHRKKLRECYKAFSLNYRAKINGQIYSSRECIEQYPSYAIWFGTAEVLAFIRFRLLIARERKEFYAQKLKEHFDKHGPIVIKDSETQL